MASRGSASTRKATDKSAPKKPHTRRSRTARQQQQAAQGDDEAVDEAASEAADETVDEAVDGSVVVDSAAEESGDEDVGAPVIDITSSPAAPPKKQDDAPPPTISVKISIDVRWFPNDHYRSIRTILPKPTEIVSTETVKTSPDVDAFDTDSPDLTCGLSRTIRSLQFDLVEDVGRSVALAGAGVATFLMTEYKAQAYYHQRHIDTLKSGKLPAPRGRETTILPFLPLEQIMELFRGKRAPRYNIVIIHEFVVTPAPMVSTPVQPAPLPNPFQTSNRYSQQLSQPQGPLPTTPSTTTRPTATPGTGAMMETVRTNRTTASRKSTTNQMLQEVEQRKDRPSNQIWATLIKMWRCDKGVKCKNYRANSDVNNLWCFVPNSESKHYPLSVTDLAGWARAVEKLQTTVNNPPAEYWNRYNKAASSLVYRL